LKFHSCGEKLEILRNAGELIDREINVDENVGVKRENQEGVNTLFKLCGKKKTQRLSKER
jgi:hypothetical protein